MNYAGSCLSIDNTLLSIASKATPTKGTTAVLCAADREIASIVGLGEVEIAPTSSPGVEDYIQAALAPSTRRAYSADVASFINWGGLIPATDVVVAEYLVVRAVSCSPRSLRRGLVGIGMAHRASGHRDPTRSELVKAVMKGINRINGRPLQQASALLAEDLIKVMEAIGGDVRGVRDRALLLLGFAGGFRRSELVGLDVADVEFVTEGAIVTIRKSKTDQYGAGRRIGIPHGRTRACPVKALSTWVSEIGTSDGALFRAVNKRGVCSDRLTGQSVSLILRKRAQAAGLIVTRVSAHSLRAGFVTSAVRAGVGIWKIKQQTGHRSDAVLSSYIRDAEMFEENAAGRLL